MISHNTCYLNLIKGGVYDSSSTFIIALILLHKIFSFNPQVKSIHPKSWQSELDSDERMVKLNEKCCLHQKELRKKYYGIFSESTTLYTSKGCYVNALCISFRS